MNKTGHTTHGKWSLPGVPHRGWTCTGVEDLREPSQVCEMCEHATIRYAHIMEHPEFPEILSVGCVCAEHMENDYRNPKIRERKIKLTTKRKLNWLKREWKNSQKGNFYMNIDDYNIVIFAVISENQKCWKIRIENRGSKKEQYGGREYSSVEDAKMGAFNALEWAKTKHLLD